MTETFLELSIFLKELHFFHLSKFSKLPDLKLFINLISKQ